MKRRKRTNSQVPAKGRLRDMADALWSLAVRADWDNRCAVCGKRKCEAHHLIPRQHESTRYLLRNGIALCATHHQFDAALSPHVNAAGWMWWLEQHHPDLFVWYAETVKAGTYREFAGTKTALYYCGILRGLKQYTSEAEFERVCGMRFSEYLLEEKL